MYRNQKIRTRFMSSVEDSRADMEYKTHNYGILSVQSHVALLFFYSSPDWTNRPPYNRMRKWVFCSVSHVDHNVTMEVMWIHCQDIIINLLGLY